MESNFKISATLSWNKSIMWYSRGNFSFVYLKIIHSVSRGYVWIWKKQFSRVPSPIQVLWNGTANKRSWRGLFYTDDEALSRSQDFSHFLCGGGGEEGEESITFLPETTILHINRLLVRKWWYLSSHLICTQPGLRRNDQGWYLEQTDRICLTLMVGHQM